MKKHVVCIEKNSSICFLIETLLKNKYTVVSVQNNYQAMAHIAAGSQIDCIILSIENSEDENIELLYHLGSSSLLQAIPVIVLSNSKSEELKSLCFESNVYAFFTKPFNPLELSKTIDETMKNTSQLQILYKKRNLFNLN